MSSWTERETNLLRESAMQGKTVPLIEAILKKHGFLRTQKAIIRAAKRKGITFTDRKKSKKKNFEKKSFVKEAEIKSVTEETHVGVTLLKCGPNQCKWGLNNPDSAKDLRFCGEKTESRMLYCEQHNKLSYRNYVPRKPGDSKKNRKKS